jgi:hypothetical protein
MSEFGSLEGVLRDEFAPASELLGDIPAHKIALGQYHLPIDQNGHFAYCGRVVSIGLLVRLNEEWLFIN